MDPITTIGLVASVITLIEVAKPLYSQLGPSNKNKEELKRLITVLGSFKASFENLISLQASSGGTNRDDLLSYVTQPVQECMEVLEYLRVRLENLNIFSKYVTGKGWDKSFNRCLQKLEDSQKLCDIIIQGDQL